MKQLLAWRFERRIFHEIVEAGIRSDKLQKQQTDRLRRALNSQPKERRHTHLISTRHVPEACSFVPLSSTAAVYTKYASNHRPYQVWLYDHTHLSHTMLHEDVSPSCTVDVALTRDRQFVTINSNSRTSSEVSIIKSGDLLNKSCDLSPLLLRGREELVEYYVEHAHGRFYILTNLGADREYKLLTATDQAPHSWDECYCPEPGTTLQDMEVYEGGVVLYARRGGVPLVIVILQGEEEPLTLCGSEFTQIDMMEEECGFTSECWGVWLSSPVSPPALHTLTPSREVTVYGTEKDDRYCIERRGVVSEDGTEVPMTLCYRGDLLRHSPDNPVLVQVYGCYGECVPTGYRPENAPLLDRGWVLAFAHTRGGGEEGRGWYYGGMGKNKHKTFEDLYACVKHLHGNLSCPELTALSGQSAGGVPVGMFCNLWPHLLQAAILEVPLVNLYHSLLDSTHYLTCKDYQEFGGNPRSTAGEREYISSICPYSCLQVQDYPAMHISAARHDSVVAFTGVCDYVSRLRESIAQYHGPTRSHDLAFNDSIRSSDIKRGVVVFEVDQIGGHHGNGAWRDREKKVSQQLLFLHKAMQLELT